MKFKYMLCCLMSCFAVDLLFSADDVKIKKEFKVKREAVFEFAKKPTVSRKGDKITIAFETRGFCDVTVAIEDAEGTILRHLACGVLGPNAPRPFAKNSRAQAIAWDGKNDQGRYVAENAADYANVRVRVSLGVKARFERHFLWSPHRRICNQGHAPTLNAPAPFVARPEGVYVFDGSMHDHLRLFDHEGNYLRTVYPFPGKTLDQLKGVETRTFPQSGKTLPFKDGNYRSTLLTSGTNYKGPYLQQLFGLAATAMAVQKGRIALACRRLNRLATDGSTGGLSLEGPETEIRGFLPRSAAFSPDGKTVYVTGWNKAVGRPNWRVIWIQGVAKIDFENGKKMETFAGVLTSDRRKRGTEPGKFKGPVSVDTDPQGRVYVADRFNDRIQIFDPSGKHLKDLSVPGGDHSLPSEVVINQRNGDIFVFSWYMCGESRKHGFHKRNAVMFHFGPFDNPKLKGTYPLPIPNQSRRGRYGGDRLQGREFRATIDPWASKKGAPSVWLVAGAAFGQGGSIKAISPIVFRMNPKTKKLQTVKHFFLEASGDLPENGYWGNGTKWLAARQTTDELYVVRGNRSVVITPDTGKARNVKLPMSPMGGAVYFGPKGYAYLRATRYVGRFDVIAGDRWREIPFDYGEQLGGRIGAIPVPTPSIHNQPGFSVSLHQDIILGYIIGKVKTHDRSKDKARQKARSAWTPWKPEMYEGRGGNSIVAVWDRYGKVVHKDAVRGVGYVADVFMDRYGDIYMASEAQRHGYLDRMTGTFVKFKAKQKVLSKGRVSIPLNTSPEGPPDTHVGGGGLSSSWWQGAEWFYGGMGFCGKNNSTCHCPKFQAAHDYFARSFVPETGHYSVAVLDSAGNLILRVGRYGNVDEGVPLVAHGPKIPNQKKIGGDEISLFYPAYLATDTDNRLFIHDPGNQRIVCAKLSYHTDHKIMLKDVKERK